MNYTIGSSGKWEIDILRLKIQNKNKRIKIENFQKNSSKFFAKFLGLLNSEDKKNA